MNVQALHDAIAAVCPIDGVSGDGTIWFQPSATDAQKAAAQAVFTNWVDPPSLTTVTFLEFMALFTTAEQTAIVNSTDAQVKLFTLKAEGAGAFYLEDVPVKAGLDYLVSVGVLTSERETAILANQPPPA